MEGRHGLAAALTASMALLLAACGAPAAVSAGLPSPAGPPPVAPVALGVDRAELITDGATAAARLRRAMAGAAATIEAEIYEFDRADYAEAILGSLARGVRVTIIEDPSVAVNTTTAERLRAAGAEVRIFPDRRRQIDHVKLLIVDRRVAIFGGMNWGSHSWRNHDFDVVVSGPIVAHLESIFARDLIASGGRGAVPAPPPPDPPQLSLVTTYPEAQVRPAVLDAISAARRSVFIEMYVMTDSETIAALTDAARRGVSVFTLFDPNQDLNQLAAGRLRAAGAKVRFYRSSGEKLHAKAMVVDVQRLVVGSANWTSSGFLHNHELDAVIDSPGLASQALVRMEADWEASG
jgi:phosphatidylserine/phosphatidylglycerophosphate/cardiolipin synthase-like enzyme